MINDNQSLLRHWAVTAKSRKILHMTEDEVKEFAEKNNLAIYNIGFSGSPNIIGWRLYPKDENGDYGELYYVVEKI